MVVPVKTAGGFEHGSPTALFALSTLAVVGAINYRQYAISSDGTRVLVNVLQRTSETTPLTVVHNWLAMRN